MRIYLRVFFGIYVASEKETKTEDLRKDNADSVTPVNIIAIMNESWFDYRSVGDPQTSEPAYANFILLKIQKEGLTSADVFEACIKKGLMIRDCSSFQCLDGEFVRFCIMMPEDNTRLLDVLKQL